MDTAAAHISDYIYQDIHPSAETSDEPEANAPLGGPDFDEPPTAPPTVDEPAEEPVDPASLAEEGGRYDAQTGDYYDSDGDRYYLDENGDRVYYAE